MREIQLSQQGKNKGKFVALVDDEDYERVNKFRWCACQYRGTIYAKRRLKTEQGKRIQSMHEFIMGEKGIDHIDGVGLNCQRSNMRKCTQHQNIMNKSAKINTSSRFKGVYWNKANKKFRTSIMLDGKHFDLGCYHNEIEAAKMYNAKAKELFGEFAKLNKI